MDNAPAKSRAVAVKEEINRQLSDPETLKSLLDTTFKGLEAGVAKRAMLEGMLRGFKFEDFLEKNIYAIPYGSTYSLVTSIDYARKIGARSGIVGVDAPKYETDDKGNIVSCSMTVKKKIEEYIGDFTAEVYFKEFTTGKNLWASKPHAMINKVAEMHALRKACPEELAQSYVEEEIREGREIREVPVVDVTEWSAKLEACTTKEQLEKVWADMPGDAKVALKSKLEEIKGFIQTEAKDIE